jgi:autotransporter translocation and assembly factor TamB
VLAKVLEVVRQRDAHLALTMESANTIAKVAGAVDCNMRGCVSFSGSARSPDLKGEAECSGEAVSLALSGLTLAEVRVILEVLTFRRRQDIWTS